MTSREIEELLGPAIAAAIRRGAEKWARNYPKNLSLDDLMTDIASEWPGMQRGRWGFFAGHALTGLLAAGEHRRFTGGAKGVIDAVTLYADAMVKAEDERNTRHEETTK